MSDGGYANLELNGQWDLYPEAEQEISGNLQAATADGPAAPFTPYPVDWRFLPDDLLIAKDWLRAKWIDTVGIELRSAAFQRIWAATFARHLVKPVLDSGILFVHVPRTAGTSICSQLYGRNLPHWTVETWKGLLGPQAHGLQSFSVLRDPLDRLMSLYRFIRQRGTKLMAAPRYDPFDLHSAADFEDFLDRLWGAEADRGKPVHLRPQSHCVTDRAGRVAVDRLFAFNAVYGLPAALNRWLDLPAVPHLNASRRDEVEVSPPLRARIEQHYAADFDLFQRVEDAGGMLIAR